MKSNILYVNYKDEAERSRLTEEYVSMGYYVTVVGDRIKVNSIHPKKKKDDKKGDKDERKVSRMPKRERSDRQ